MTLRGVLALMLLLALGVLGCGGDDEPDDAADSGDETGGEVGGGAEEATFDVEGFDISFQYPSDFEQRDEVDFSRSAGSSPAETAAVGIDETNLIAVQRFDLESRVSDRNFERVKREADELFSQLAGEPVEGIRRRVAGSAALEYQIPLEQPADAETRAIAVFDGDTEYLFNCQSEPELRERIDAACDRALFTLEIDSQE